MSPKLTSNIHCLPSLYTPSSLKDQRISTLRCANSPFTVAPPLRVVVKTSALVKVASMQGLKLAMDVVRVGSIFPCPFATSRAAANSEPERTVVREGTDLIRDYFLNFLRDNRMR